MTLASDWNGRNGSGRIGKHRNFVAMLVALATFSAGSFSHSLQPSAMGQEDPAELSGLTADEIFEIQDGGQLNPTDKILDQLLYRASKTSQRNFQKFAKHTDGVTLADVATSPRDFRCYVFRFSGRAKFVSTMKVDPTADDELLTKFNVIHFEIDESNRCLVVVPKNAGCIPKRWPRNSKINEACTFTGFFASNREFETNNEWPVFVSPLIQWFPDSSSGDDKWLATSSERFLAEHGVDITQFDVIRNNINGPVVQELTPSFFQFLKACQQMEVKNIPDERVNFTKCLSDPKNNIGAATTIRGKVRRVEKVLVTDPHVKATLGNDHYYQLQIFCRLENHRIAIQQNRSKNANQNAQSPAPPVVHENRYPVTVCVPELPGDESDEGKLLKESVVVSGFFFKLWNYVSTETDAENRHPIQVVPLIIGTTPEIESAPDKDFDFWLSIITITGLIGFTGLFLLFRMGNSNGKGREKIGIRSGDLPETIEIPESPVE